MTDTEIVVPARLMDCVLLPGDAEYQTARRVDNAVIDRHPAAIVQARDADDVRATVGLAVATGMALTVRGGGYSTPGYGVANDAIALDMRGIHAIQIDVEAGTAWVGAGATAGDVAAALHLAGFAIPFGESGSVGIGGLTLGGGIGWLVRRHGLTIDNLLAAEVITAAGDRLTASASENPDLFWALRGGGGNFGVVTRFRFNLTPMDTVLAGRVNVQATPDALRNLVDVLFAAPDGLTVAVSLLQARRVPADPDGWQARLPDAWRGRLVASLHFAYSGPIEDDGRVLDLLRSFGPTVEDSVRRRPYPALFPPPSGARIGTAVRSMFLDDLGDEAIEVITRRMADPAMPDAWIFLHTLGGAVARVPNSETAFGHRDRRASLTLIAPFEDLAAAVRHEDWVAGFEAELLAAGCGPGAFVNYLGTSGDAALHAAYPQATFARLREIKRRYDPANLFRSNLNVPPATDSS